MSYISCVLRVILLLLVSAQHVLAESGRDKAFDELERETSGHAIPVPESETPAVQEEAASSANAGLDGSENQVESYQSAGSPPNPVYEDNRCGKHLQGPCSFSTARKIGQKATGCGSYIYDPIDGGTCWQCPDGYNRTVLHGINTARACEKAGGEKRVAASLTSPTGLIAKTNCSFGKLDPLAGVCFRCPNGFNRTGYPVKSDKACSMAVPPQQTTASLKYSLNCPAGSFFDGIDDGSCWSCPVNYTRSWSSVKAIDACVATTFGGLGVGVCMPGLSNIRGVCLKLGECGSAANRPCEIGERIPSCNAGFKEDFKSNTCKALQPGESAFLGGLSSATDYYGDAVRATCKQAISGIRFSSATDLGIGANCTKDIFSGVACEFVAKAAGAEVTDQISAATGMPGEINAFVRKVEQQYNASPCNALTENLKPAVRHGTANGTTCPNGQFWDPNGNCYSCPANFTRTLNNVASNAACVDKPAAGMARAACSVYQAATVDFLASANCTKEILSNGTFTSANPIDLHGASTQVCLATGEMVYAVYSLLGSKNPPEKKAEKLIEALNTFSRVAKTGHDVLSAGQAGVEVTKGFVNLANCR